MKNFKPFAILLAFSTFGFSAQAQDKSADNHQITVVIPEVALLDIEAGTRDFVSTFVQSAEAGDKITAPTANSDLWLNYSSIIPNSVESRRVEVSANTLVSGVDIAVVAKSSVSGAGSIGSPNGTVTLKDGAQTLIDKIGSAYTVSGKSKGHQLTYSFTALDENYARLRADKVAVTVTYTLVDN